MWEIEKISKGICLCFLAICSWQDIKRREISVSFLWVGSLLGIVSFICRGRECWYLYLSGAGIGIVFLIISKVTKEAIGYGDGWIVCIMGSFLGIWSLLEALAAAWMFLAAAAMVCLVKKKWSRKSVLPMVPFLTAGYVVSLEARCV